MQRLHRGGNQYRVSGANQTTGQDVEITVEAYDEADASRTANRQGIFVSTCVAVAAEGTFSRAISDDVVVQKLLEWFPALAYRISRLTAEDQAYLSDLSNQHGGVTQCDSDHVRELIRANRHLIPT